MRLDMNTDDHRSSSRPDFDYYYGLPSISFGLTIDHPAFRRVANLSPSELVPHAYPGRPNGDFSLYGKSVCL